MKVSRGAFILIVLGGLLFVPSSVSCSVYALMSEVSGPYSPVVLIGVLVGSVALVGFIFALIGLSMVSKDDSP